MRGHLLRALLMAVTLVVAAAAPAQPGGRSDSREYSVALGVACDHCHIEGDWRAPAKLTFDFARRMAAMVRGLNTGPLSGRAPLTCWSCHRGRPIPARLPPAAWEDVASAYAPVFANLHADQEVTMSVYAASLGVRCTHCHVQDAWADRSRPSHSTAVAMASMFDLIPTFFDAAVRTPRTQCFMCHQGRTVVAREPQAP